MTTKNTLDPRALLEGTTLGPWREFHGDITANGDSASDYDDYVIAGIGKSTGSRSSVYSPVMLRSPTGKANARLIAAAPQLAQSNIAMSERIAELRHDVRRAQQTSSELATENATLHKGIAELREALERIATVDMGGGFLGAQACREIARTTLSQGEGR